MLLAIDTSCDETALTVLDIGKVLQGDEVSEKLILSEIISSQVKLHKPYGGVVPELASREHLKNFPVLFEDVLTRAKIEKSDISAVAVTSGPGLNGCLLVGLCFAKSFAAVRKVPLLALNHIEGHIFASELMGRQIMYPALALVVSGGHTMLVSMDGFRQYKILAKTRDDAAGEAFDKAANILGLGYPGGAVLSQYAERGDRLAYKLPVGLNDNDDAFSFSGLKTAVLRLVSLLRERGELSEQVTFDVCASVQHAIAKALVEKTVRAIRKVNPKDLILVGGVASNQYLRDWLEREAGVCGVNFTVPHKRWCTDNASMMASLATRVIVENKERFLSWKPGGSDMGIDTPYDVSALPRSNVA